MKKMRSGLRTLRLASLAVFILVSFSSTSQATPIDPPVPLDPYPAILAGFITSTYNVTTGLFEARGWTTTLDTGTGQQSFMNEFLVRANVSKEGVASSGSLSIGTGGSLLASGSLLQFAYDHVSGGMIEFLFAPVSGSLVDSGMYTASKPVDVLLYGLGTRFPGRFDTSWAASNGSAQIKVDPPAPGPVPVPEPSTLTLMLLATAGLFTRGRLRSAAPPAH